MPKNAYENLMLPHIQSVFFYKAFSLQSVIVIGISSTDEADCLVHDHLHI